MIIFRPHRASLSLYEAMAEAKEFTDVDEMKEYIVKTWHKDWFGEEDLFTADDIVIAEDSVMNDDRIGWEDSKYVCVKRCGDKVYTHPQCIGMCATKYPAQKPS